MNYLKIKINFLPTTLCWSICLLFRAAEPIKKQSHWVAELMKKQSTRVTGPMKKWPRLLHLILDLRLPFRPFQYAENKKKSRQNVLQKYNDHTSASVCPRRWSNLLNLYMTIIIVEKMNANINTTNILKRSGKNDRTFL